MFEQSGVNLEPGLNIVKVSVNIAGKTSDGYGEIGIYGGKSYFEPMVPSSWVSFCKGTQSDCDQPVLAQQENSPPQTASQVPLEISAEGDIIPWRPSGL